MSKLSVSVTASTYARLKKRSEETGQSIASIVEEATKDCVVSTLSEDHPSSPDTSPAPISSSSSCETAST